jgi:hypothetical protein
LLSLFLSSSVSPQIKGYEYHRKERETVEVWMAAPMLVQMGFQLLLLHLDLVEL